MYVFPCALHGVTAVRTKMQAPRPHPHHTTPSSRPAASEPEKFPEVLSSTQELSGLWGTTTWQASQEHQGTTGEGHVWILPWDLCTYVCLVSPDCPCSWSAAPKRANLSMKTPGFCTLVNVLLLGNFENMRQTPCFSYRAVKHSHMHRVLRTAPTEWDLTWE